MGTRRKFTDEFKREAVKLAKQPGVALTTVSRELGVDEVAPCITGHGSRLF